MLNQRPIFLHCFTHGGSSTLADFLISHPLVCNSSGETHKVFKPGTNFDVGLPRLKKLLLYDYPIRLITRQDYFRPRLLEERKPVPRFLREYIDRILYYGRFTAMVETHNLYKSDTERYTREELAKCRLLTKGLDGIVYTAQLFHEMYPDARFFGMVRNGLAICEGYVRRGATPEFFGNIYNRVAEKMLEVSRKIPHYHILRYEEMVADPVSFLKKVYPLADLNIDDVPKFRVLTRPITDKDGKRVLMKGEFRQVLWYPLNELKSTIRSDINENQIRQLGAENRRRFLAVAGATMERLGYSTN
jgi:hypothetical protein